MNRNFLIMLMIGTAMLITVIGQHDPANQLNSQPWEVTTLENGSLRVFGITLEKTSIQEANQILADFAQTQLQVTHFSHNDNRQDTSLQLNASYAELSIGGLNAKIQLTYRIEENELRAIFNTLKIGSSTEQASSVAEPATNKPQTVVYPVSDKVSINYLSNRISVITYIPSIDYDLDTIRQNFGIAKQEEQINESLMLWHYPNMGLKIFIDTNKPDQFVYGPLY